VFLSHSSFQKQNEFNFIADLVRDMVQDDPTQRPTMDQVVVQFETIRKKLSNIKLRSPLLVVNGIFPHIASHLPEY